jgi:hypothetical protein
MVSIFESASTMEGTGGRWEEANVRERILLVRSGQPSRSSSFFSSFCIVEVLLASHGVYPEGFSPAGGNQEPSRTGVVHLL